MSFISILKTLLGTDLFSGDLLVFSIQLPIYRLLLTTRVNILVASVGFFLFPLVETTTPGFER